ncbi:MAG TPA: class I SAM-dependent methyltransferase, partial [Candidatus Limnocylindria bacterium]|nr:class I SAM-dependent methyltransferase [Candidatus Limnocylindria bacterium]
MKDLQAVYARRFSDEDAARQGLVWRELARYLQRYVPADGRVLDIACDRGAFISNIDAHDKWAVDLRDVSAHLPPDVRFIQSDGLGLRDVLPNGTFDLVFMSNYLEHLPSADAVVDQLKVVHDLLSPAGRVLILQPNIRLVGGSYWDFLDHKTALTEKSLAEAAETAGLATVEVITRFLPYTT